MLAVHDLPAVNAGLNSLSAVLLIAGYVMIRRRKIGAHRGFMIAACTSSLLFLATYLTYHALTGSTRFQTPGAVRTIYLAVLLTHTVLAAVIAPLVVMTLVRALRSRFDQHRKIARWTWPLWMYVSVTGVVIYLMLYHLDPWLSARAG